MQHREHSVANRLRTTFGRLLGDSASIAIRFWDDSVLGAPDASTTIRVRSEKALRTMFWAPGELGLARAYVAGDIELDGDIYAVLSLRDHLGERADTTVEMRLSWPERLTLVKHALQLGALGPPPAPPPEEIRLRGTRHSRQRDAAAISHHYDISNDFYRLVLGESMTYSCAAFVEEDLSLSEAQSAKYELVSRKLGLSPGMRLLDVGCGWGGMLLHAARHHGVEGVGVTVSKRQAELATERVRQAGLEGRIEIRLQDYRDIADGPYDAISSIGMFEHVGLARLKEYFTTLRSLVHDGGRVLNHGIARPAPSTPRFNERSFVDRYVFPDGELHEVGSVVSSMQECGLEVRDVECLREHYGRTLRAWVANLEANWVEAVRLVGVGRARVWRLYMAGSALGFEANRISIHQVLAVRTSDSGESAMPASRLALLGAESMATTRRHDQARSKAHEPLLEGAGPTPG